MAFFFLTGKFHSHGQWFAHYFLGYAAAQSLVEGLPRTGYLCSMPDHRGKIKHDYKSGDIQHSALSTQHPAPSTQQVMMGEMSDEGLTQTPEHTMNHASIFWNLCVFLQPQLI